MRKLFNLIKLIFFIHKWKKNNKHNRTYPGNFFDESRVNVGNYTYGQLNVRIYGSSQSKLILGNLCSIADNTVFILDGEHHVNYFTTYPMKQSFIGDGLESFSKGDIVIEDDVWIGYGTTILSGIKIGRGAVIAAGSVVTKDVPPYAVIGGVPGKIIKYRFDNTMISELMKIDFSKLDRELLVEHIDQLYTELSDIDQIKWMPRITNDLEKVNYL